MKLVWHQRKDGLWNAACACNASLCGVEFVCRAEAEAWHFDRAHMERKHRFETTPALAAGNQIPACGPKLPEPNPNEPSPLVFP